MYHIGKSVTLYNIQRVHVSIALHSTEGVIYR